MRIRAKFLIKRQLGRALSWLRPDIVRKIESAVATHHIPAWSETPLIERLILEAVLARHMAARDEDKLEAVHKAYWAGDRSLGFHDRAHARFQDASFGEYDGLFKRLEEVVTKGGYDRLCEIGCGSGSVVNQLAEMLPALTEVVGLDLSATQIAINQERFSNPRLRFIAADAAAWVPQYARQGTVYLTYGGVLEYFTQAAIEAMLRSIAPKTPVCFALIEPLAHDYDLEREAESRLFGSEMSLSHNYPRLFAAAGFRVHWQQELPHLRELMMIAIKDESDVRHE